MWFWKIRNYDCIYDIKNPGKGEGTQKSASIDFCSCFNWREFFNAFWSVKQQLNRTLKFDLMHNKGTWRTQCLKISQKVAFHNFASEASNVYYRINIWIFAPNKYFTNILGHFETILKPFLAWWLSNSERKFCNLDYVNQKCWEQHLTRSLIDFFKGHWTSLQKDLKRPFVC